MPENEQNTAIDNHGARFANVGTVNIGPVTNQSVVHDRSVTYDGERADEGMTEIARLIIRLLGRARVGALVWLTGPLGLLLATAATAGARYLPPHVGQQQIFVFGVVLVFIAAALFAVLHLQSERRCVKCDADFSLAEYQDPSVKEKNVRGGTQEKTTRYLECSKCSHRTTRVERRVLEDEEKD